MQPNVVMFTNIIDAFAKKGDTRSGRDSAHELLSVQERTHRSAPEPEPSAHPAWRNGAQYLEDVCHHGVPEGKCDSPLSVHRLFRASLRLAAPWCVAALWGKVLPIAAFRHPNLARKRPEEILVYNIISYMSYTLFTYVFSQPPRAHLLSFLPRDCNTRSLVCLEQCLLRRSRELAKTIEEL